MGGITEQLKTGPLGSSLDGQGLGKVVPKVADGIDPRQLPLDAVHASVLALVDGRRNVAEICRRADYPTSETIDVLTLLCIGGAITLPGPSTRATSTGPLRRRITTLNPAIDIGLELDSETRYNIDAKLALASLRDASVLLGVPQGSDEATVRRAYFRLAKEFHPDRFFGRQLGPYKERIARLFAAITDAYHELQPRR